MPWPNLTDEEYDEYAARAMLLGTAYYSRIHAYATSILHTYLDADTLEPIAENGFGKELYRRRKIFDKAQEEQKNERTRQAYQRT